MLIKSGIVLSIVTSLLIVVYKAGYMHVTVSADGSEEQIAVHMLWGDANMNSNFDACLLFNNHERSVQSLTYLKSTSPQHRIIIQE